MIVWAVNHYVPADTDGGMVLKGYDLFRKRNDARLYLVSIIDLPNKDWVDGTTAEVQERDRDGKLIGSWAIVERETRVAPKH